MTAPSSSPSMPSSSPIESLSDVHHFVHAVLPRVESAYKLTESEIRSFFRWAAVAEQSFSHMASHCTEEGLGGTESEEAREATRTLFVKMLDNPRLSKQNLNLALRLLEERAGFPDAEARCSLRQRNAIRSSLVTASSIHTDRYFKKAVKRGMTNMGMEEVSRQFDPSVDPRAIALCIDAGEKERAWLGVLSCSMEHDLIVSSCLEDVRTGGHVIEASKKCPEFVSALLRHCAKADEEDVALDLLEILLAKVDRLRMDFRKEDCDNNGYVGPLKEKLLKRWNK